MQAQRVAVAPLRNTLQSRGREAVLSAPTHDRAKGVSANGDALPANIQTRRSVLKGS